ncbi:MAG: hypothetical protein KKF85_00680 [Gammaproteobacteria bacterium]|nr:hypothetical protein [Rhodocyclaceae bacterium]MBU3908271.1 hypothetical protein [Gammaproteobacteria bacterium]MBU3989869.1 hypothetical protein [Gammaproteobacteria bacterium]MBU4003092.1 hypothetical protein [Gammaproteobacteria bacterium]MBU4019934.1 hypothetical protein [Gammaproteobacteria bacterium]
MTRQAGLGKLEFAVVLAIFGVLAHILLDRLVALERETERLEVDLTVRHINTGIKLAVGDAIMRGEETRIAAMINANPLTFLGHEQERKVGPGATAQPDATNMGAVPALAGWSYDAGRHTLYYRPRQPEAFSGRENLRWRFTSHTDELGRIAGLRLEPLK